MSNHHLERPPRPTSPNHNHDSSYVQFSPAPPSTGKNPMDKMFGALDRCGKRLERCSKNAEVAADNIWHHLRVSPSITDAVMAKLAQGTKVLAEGGHERVFQHTFGDLPGEKLFKEYACYLSTSSGPVIGTLYISTKRIAFCSDYPLCYYPSPSQPQWIFYKVVMHLDQLAAVNPSSNRFNPTEKYIELVTTDGHEFWFMGFVSYDKVLKSLNEALHRSHDCFRGA